MISITKAAEKDNLSIASIGKVSVHDAHKDSCPAADLDEFLERNYNPEAIRVELNDPGNIYHIIYYNETPAGFSKIVLNAKHPGIARENVTKLDRIYLLKKYHGLKVGLELLNFNIAFAQKNGQSGMWLYTWTGNRKAIEFYNKAGFSIIGSHDFYVSKRHANPNHHMFLDWAGS